MHRQSSGDCGLFFGFDNGRISHCLRGAVCSPYEIGVTAAWIGSVSRYEVGSFQHEIGQNPPVEEGAVVGRIQLWMLIWMSQQDEMQHWYYQSQQHPGTYPDRLGHTRRPRLHYSLLAIEANMMTAASTAEARTSKQQVRLRDLRWLVSALSISIAAWEVLWTESVTNWSSRSSPSPC